MSSKTIALTIAVLALVWILSGFLFGKPPSEDSQSPVVDAELTQSETKKVRIKTLRAISVTDDVLITGRTQASRQVILRSETESQVLEILKKEGTFVKAGEVIAKLDIRDRGARLSEAQEELNQRDIEYSAAKELESRGFNSKISLAQALANLEKARAALKVAQIEKTRTSIRAPYDGMIYNQEIEVGDLLKVADPMVSIVDLEPAEITGYVSERRVGDLALDQVVQVQLVNGIEAKGVVSYIAPAADEQTRTFRIEVNVPNPERKIKAGLTANMRIAVSQKLAHKISPSILSLNDEGKIGVKIVNDQNTVEFFPVRILSDRAEAMYVLGLPEEAKIITVGQDYVSHGSLVTPVESTVEGLL